MTTLGMVGAALLRERKMRNIVAALSVAIAMGLLTVSLSMTKRLHDIVAESDEGRILSRSRIEGQPLTVLTLTEIAKVPGIRPVWYERIDAFTVDRNMFFLSAFGPEVALLQNTRAWHSSPEAIACWQKNRNGAIVKDSAMRRVGWTVGRIVSFAVAGKAAVSFLICGEFTGSTPASFYAHLDYYDELNAERGTLDTITSECTTPDKRCTAQHMVDLDRTSAGWNAATLTMFEMQHQMRRVRTVSAVPNVLQRVSILAVLITLLITASTLGMNLDERRGEFATLRALGFGRLRISLMVQLESILLCTAGGLLGSIVPLALFFEHGFSLGNGHLRDVRVEPGSVLLAVVLSIATGFLVALLPSIRMARHDVLEDLREN